MLIVYLHKNVSFTCYQCHPFVWKLHRSVVISWSHHMTLTFVLDQDPMADMPPGDDYDDDDESVNLLDVSSDVEIDPAELDGLDDSEDDEK